MDFELLAARQKLQQPKTVLMLKESRQGKTRALPFSAQCGAGDKTKTADLSWRTFSKNKNKMNNFQRKK
jgi:hypothetical protein